MAAAGTAPIRSSAVPGRFIPRTYRSMTRIIQLTGAMLGTLVGFALGLALLQRAGDLVLPANRPAFLTAFVVATLLFGYLACLLYTSPSPRD